MRVKRLRNRKVVGGTLASCVVLGLSATALMTSSAVARPTASAASGKSLELIEVSTGIPYYNPLVSAFKAEAKKLGDTGTVVGPAAISASSQIPDIQQATVKHIQGIAIQPNDDKAPLPALQQAKAAGAKILEVNNDSLHENIRVAGVTALNYGNVPAGQLAQLGALMHYSGDFAILSAATTSIFQNQVIAGEKKLLRTDPKYHNMHLVKVVYGNDQSAPSYTATNALLTEFPNLKAITSPTTVGIAGAAQAIDAAHKGGKIILTGLGEPIEMKKYILNGTVKEYQLWNVANMGTVSAWVLDQAINGVSFPPGKKFTVPGSGLGTLTVSADGDIYCQKGLTVFNKANVNKYNF
jgi:rhamnose transport system substrate-binding protein